MGLSTDFRVWDEKQSADCADYADFESAKIRLTGNVYNQIEERSGNVSSAILPPSAEITHHSSPITHTRHDLMGEVMGRPGDDPAAILS
jgi:hypothetical protein